MKHFAIGLAILVLILAGMACADTPTRPSTGVPDGGVGLFQSFYDYWGGKETLGEVISDVKEEGGTQVQFTENVKMVWNPNAPLESRFSLAPLGVQMGYVEPTAPAPSNPTYHYLNGHAIPPLFYQKFEKMGGKDIVGLPTTEELYDPAKGRYYQYFERVGFYRLLSSNQVHLIPYGLMACDAQCRRSSLRQNLTIEPPPKIHPAFQAEVERLGIDFTGFAATKACVTSDRRSRQVMANVVLETGSPGQPGGVRLYPLASKVGIVAEAPRPNQHGEGMYFLATEGQLGFEVPQYFWEYLRQRGGIQVSGLPITHLAPDRGGYRQCFTNMCLSYQAQRARQVSPEPLGIVFAEMFPDPSTPAPMIQRFVTVKAWDGAQVISSLQQQEIGALVLADNQPVANVVLVLELMLLDGRREEFLMPPTGTDGKTTLRLDAIQAANGTLVYYRACYLPDGVPAYCTPQESFVIWGNP